MTLKVFGVAALALAVSLGAFAETPVETPTVEPAITAAEAQADPANWRKIAPENLFVFETTKGRILIEAFPEVAPKHYQQFSTLVRSGDYAGTSFHRVINGFMAQGGDIFALHNRESGLPDIPGEFTFKRNPNAMKMDAMIGPEDSAPHGYLNGFPMATQPLFLSEMNTDGLLETYIPHCRGIVSTARTSDPNSANSQFFLMRDHSPHLDRQYTAWGRVVEGEDVVLAIKAGSQSLNGAVVDPDILKSTAVASDLPEDERPEAWSLRTDGPQFAAQLAEVIASSNSGEPHICSLSSVPTVSK